MRNQQLFMELDTHREEEGVRLFLASLWKEKVKEAQEAFCWWLKRHSVDRSYFQRPQKPGDETQE